MLDDKEQTICERSFSSGEVTDLSTNKVETNLMEVQELLLHCCALEFLARFGLWSNGFLREGKEERFHYDSIRHPFTFMESGTRSAKGLDGSAVVRGVFR